MTNSNEWPVLASAKENWRSRIDDCKTPDDKIKAFGDSVRFAMQRHGLTDIETHARLIQELAQYEYEESR